jgi:hypothetical protein
MKEEISWADIHPYMSDEELEEHIRILSEQYEKDPAEERFFYRPL